MVLSKADLPAVPGLPAGLRVSARTGEGLARLRSRLEAEAVARAGGAAETLLTRPRHRAALQEAAEWLAALDGASLPELRAEALRAALRAVGRITGRVGVEAVLDSVFAEFCIGK